MKKYIVYTAAGIYHVSANNRDAARDAVYKLTFGRVSPADMTVEARA